MNFQNIKIRMSIKNGLLYSFKKQVFIFVKNNIMYPAEIVKPMKDELTSIGFDELLSSEAVENSLSKAWDDVGRGKLSMWLCCGKRTPRSQNFP